MGMNIASGGQAQDPDVMVDINTTPLIDVMLVLLIMLIITIPIQTHAVKLDMPVGLITTAWGGTRIQTWVPPQGYTAIPELDGEKNEWLGMLNGYADALAGYAGSVKSYNDTIKAAKPGDALPQPPGALPGHPLNSNYNHTGLYNGMIHPIIPFGIRGFLWYQGESNNGQGMHYFQLKKGLIEGWRSVWNQEGNRDLTQKCP